MTAYYVTQTILLLLLVGIAWMMPALVRPTVPFGVRVPLARAHDPAIGRAVRDYRRVLLGGGILLIAASPALTLALGRPYLLSFGIVAALLLWWLAYARAHRRLATLKARERWYEGLRQGIVVDTSLRSAPPPFPFVWAIPALVIAGATLALGLWRYPALVIAGATLALGLWRYPALPATLLFHYGADGLPDRYAAKSIWSAFGLVLVQWATIALLLILATFSGRFRADLDIEALERSIAQHRRTAGALQRASLLLAACVALTFLGVCAAIWGLIPAGGATFGLIVLVPIVGIVGVLLLIARATATDPAAPGRTEGDYVHRDDDALWRGGVLYVNRDDPALFVPKRFGIGWTLNMGHPAAWTLLLLILAALVGLGLFGAITAR